MDCKQTVEFMMCGGAKYCENPSELNKDIKKYNKLASAYSELEDGILYYELKHNMTIKEIREKISEYAGKNLFLMQHKTLIKVFCIGDAE